jgi:hypothetical protein
MKHYHACVVTGILMNGIVIAAMVAVAAGQTASQAPGWAAIQKQLGAASTSREAISPQDATLILQMLASPDETSCWTALGMFEARLSPYRTDLSPAVRKADRARLMPGQTKVLELLGSERPRIRREAVRAAMFLRISRSLPGKDTSAEATLALGFDPGRDLAVRLARMFDTEPDAAVRSQIVGALVGTGADVEPETTRIVNALLIKALSDPSPGVVSTAVRDVARRRLPGSLQESVKLLKHTAYEVRMDAAQAIASFGSEARPYLADLRRAADIETDAITRKTILATITAIER